MAQIALLDQNFLSQNKEQEKISVKVYLRELRN